MKRHSWILVSLVLATGCLPKMRPEDLAEFRPERSPETDRLSMLLGDWETAGEIKLIIIDEPIHTKGRNHAEWSLDGRMLVEHEQMDMGPLGPMSGMSVWTYDDGAGKYRMWWFDSFGETSQAVARWDDAAQTWRLRTTGRKYGHSTSGSGTVHKVDDNTLEWTWIERGGLGLIKFATMRGTSHRIGPAPSSGPEKAEKPRG